MTILITISAHHLVALCFQILRVQTQLLLALPNPLAADKIAKQERRQREEERIRKQAEDERLQRENDMRVLEEEIERKAALDLSHVNDTGNYKAF